MTNRTREGALARANVRIGAGQRSGLGPFCGASVSVSQMSSPSTRPLNLLPSLRGLARGWGWTLLAFTSAVAGCFGGQTGTEFSPPSHDTPSSNDHGEAADGGTLGGDKQTGANGGTTTDISAPEVAAGPCDASEAALNELERASGVSLRALQEFAAAASPFTLLWNDGATSPANFQFEFGPAVCVRQVGAESVLVANVTLRITADDSRFNVQFSGSALAYAHLPSGVGRVELDAAAECSSANGDVPAPTCGNIGTEMRDYVAARLSLTARLQEFGDRLQLLGVIGISGLPAGSCPEEKCDAAAWDSVADVSLAKTD